MYRFFVDEGQIGPSTVSIVGEDVNHIKNVLRMKAGEEVAISDGKSPKEYMCKVESLAEDEILLKICSVKEGGTELASKVYLFQGLPKSDKMELVIQKTVELGCHQIVPVACRRSVVKLDGKKAESKVARWNAISEAAAKQSKRGIIPKVTEVMTFKEAIAYASKNCKVLLMPYENAGDMGKTRELIEGIRGGEDVAVFIGPEGGFDTGEVELAMENGILPITLGRRILRTETAGLTVLAWLMYQLED